MHSYILVAQINCRRTTDTAAKRFIQCDDAEGMITEKTPPARIRLTEEIVAKFSGTVFSQPPAELARRSGLPYLLVYNILKGRVQSVSRRTYLRLFGEPPPVQHPRKVDGTFFRQMVALWCYLDSDTSRAMLYERLLGKTTGKRDNRIFSGKIKSVDSRLEQRMIALFAANGVDREKLTKWIEEFNARQEQQRVPFEQIRPLLLEIKEQLGIHPNVVLNQMFGRYESGKLKTVSQAVYDRAVSLSKKAQAAHASQKRGPAPEQIRESIYGGKAGYTLFSEIAAPLAFLKKYAGKSPKRYLGRGIGAYEKGVCKRLQTWRARRIQADCRTFIATTPGLPLDELPQPFLQERILHLLGLLLARAASLLMEKENALLESKILSPKHTMDEYKKPEYGFTRFDLASATLGMKRKAFDLMVAKNCQIFRGVGRYDKRWYLSDLYLKELREKSDFSLITVKYELLSKCMLPSKQGDSCMN